jgi:transcriptional regulator of acetoin/glycerol metabolism
VRRFRETLDQSWTYRRGSGKRGSGEPAPGLLLLFTNGEPALRAIPLRNGALTLGRDELELEDSRLSRRHAEARFVGQRWHLKDLGSKNGTFVDGKPVTGELVTDRARLLRVGDSLFGLLSDVRGFEGAVVELRDGLLVGPTLRQRWDEIERAAEAGDTLHVTGESGTGKELAARHFHRSGKRASGPFVAVNCAAIPPNLAERLLFGAKRGAYSGADADAEGHVQAANGGTLFLDEIAELEPAVQAKLLRVLESREVTALGASKPKSVELGVVSATHQDLRAAAGAGKFRQDLFFRIARPHVTLPPLRDRIEEIPWLVQRALAPSAAHVSLIEECLLRPWPGNVRELLVELKHAQLEAAKQKAPRVEVEHLGADAGRELEASADSQSSAGAPALSDDQVMEALRKEGGNVTRAARAMGWHRNQLRRWLTKKNVDPSQLGDGGDDGDTEET